MIMTISGNTNSPKVIRALITNPIPGVTVTPVASGLQTRSLPDIPIAININIDIDLARTVLAAVAAYLVGRARRGEGNLTIDLNNKKISADDPGLIEAELEKHNRDSKNDPEYYG